MNTKLPHEVKLLLLALVVLTIIGALMLYGLLITGAGTVHAQQPTPPPRPILGAYLPLTIGGPAQLPFCNFMRWTDTGFQFHCNQAMSVTLGAGYMHLHWLGIAADISGCQPWGNCARYDTGVTNTAWSYDAWSGVTTVDLGEDVGEGAGYFAVSVSPTGSLSITACLPKYAECNTAWRVAK